jgi:hypothetical protein
MLKDIGREFRRFIEMTAGEWQINSAAHLSVLNSRLVIYIRLCLLFGFVPSAGTFIPEAAFIPLRAYATATLVGCSTLARTATTGRHRPVAFRMVTSWASTLPA